MAKTCTGKTRISAQDKVILGNTGYGGQDGGMGEKKRVKRSVSRWTYVEAEFSCVRVSGWPRNLTSKETPVARQKMVS